MNETVTSQDILEAARERLEKAMSTLASDAVGFELKHRDTQQRLESMEAKAKNVDDLKGALERVEMENLRLHEKIAALALGDPEDKKQIAALEEEVRSVDTNYARLKMKFTELKAELEEKESQASAEKAAQLKTVEDLEQELQLLKSENTKLIQERRAMKDRLDTAILKVEALVEGQS